MNSPLSQWFLYRTEAAQTFGPVSLQELQAWASDALIAPDDLLSSDGETWSAARGMPDLEMHYLIEITPGNAYGPISAAAIRSYIAASEVPGGARVVDSRDGKAISAAELLVPKSSPNTCATVPSPRIRVANPVRARPALSLRLQLRPSRFLIAAALPVLGILLYLLHEQRSAKRAPEMLGLVRRERATPANLDAVRPPEKVKSIASAVPSDVPARKDAAPAFAAPAPENSDPAGDSFAEEFAATVAASALAFPEETSAQLLVRGMDEWRNNHGEDPRAEAVIVEIARVASWAGSFQTWSDLLFLERTHLEPKAFASECMAEAVAVIAKNPGDSEAAFWSGWVCLTGGDAAAARGCWQQSESLSPEAPLASALDLALAILCWNAGQFPQAIAREERRLKSNAEHEGAPLPLFFARSPDLQRTAATVHAAAIAESPTLAGNDSYQYARAALVRGDFDLALSLLDPCTKLSLPDAELSAVFQDRAAVLLEKQRPEDAITDFNEVLRLAPESADAYVGRARAYKMQRLWDLAIADLHHALLIAPESTRALNAFAWLLATCPDASHRNGAEALAAAQKACDLSHWTRWVYVDTLAVAYAETGDLREAAKVQGKAIQIASGGQIEQTAMQARLALYAKGQAYHE